MAQSINNLQVGDWIRVPVQSSYQSFLGSYIYFYVADKNHSGYPNNSVTLLGRDVIKLLCMDAAEPNNSSAMRKSNGNNRYIYSNLLQWLNNNGGAGSWYTAQHTTDAPPIYANVNGGDNAYDDTAGFLTMLDSNFVSELQTTSLVVTKTSASGGDGGGSDNFSAKVFTLSVTEVTGNTVNGVAEGVQLQIFAVNDSAKLAMPTATAVTTSDWQDSSLATNMAFRYWLRTPYTNVASQQIVKADKSLGNQACYSGRNGVRIVCNIPNSLMVSDEPSSDMAYDIVYNSAPSAPSTITVPATINGGQTANISWTASSDPDGNLAGYKLERKVNNGSFTQIYQGSALSYTDSITMGWSTVQYRVCAYDTLGDVSGYTTSASKNVVNNQPPVISGSDANLGTKSADFSVTYSVTDNESDAVTVTERIDGNEIRTYSVTLGATNTFSVSGTTWLKLDNGVHTMTISATDGTSTAVRTYTFTKDIDSLSIANTYPLAADSKPTRIKLSITRSIPVGATMTVYVCNNAYDSSPTWEDATQSVTSGLVHVFSNSTKTDTNWGIGIRVEVDRNDADGECYISSIGGNFE